MTRTIKVKLRNDQKQIFDSQEKRVIFVKGRQWGFTDGLARHFIRKSVSRETQYFLWGDTINSNINRYVDRYFKPILQKQFHKDDWSWNKVDKEMHILNTTIDFRSEDKPENWEGFNYDMIALNEAGIILKNRYLYENAVLPMTLAKDAQLIVAGTPKGKKDRSGKKHKFYELWENAKKELDGYVGFHGTTYENPILSESAIQSLEDEYGKGSMLHAQEMLGEFVEGVESAILKPYWFKRYEAEPLETPTAVRLSLDTAFKTGRENDYSVIGTWKQYGKRHLKTGHKRFKAEFPELLRTIDYVIDMENPSEVIIEDKASGTPLGQVLKDKLRSRGLRIVMVNPVTDKVQRAHAAAPAIKDGYCEVPKEAPWLEEYFTELEDFPNVEHDDQVDETTQYVNKIIKPHRAAITSDLISIAEDMY